MAEPLCRAFLKGLSKHYPTLEICHAAAPDGVIRLYAAQRGTSGLEAQVFWTDLGGDKSGPVLGFDVADRALGSAMMPEFVRHLIEQSNLPDLEELRPDGDSSDQTPKEKSKCDI